MVWAAICQDGLRTIVWTEGSINSEYYCNILRENLMVKEDLNEFVLQQDGARCHGSIYTKKFMEENGIEVLPWVPYSPDVSIIENV
jgi:hypothetical protein